MSRAIESATRCGRVDCGHVHRSESRAVKRALFLYLCESDDRIGAGVMESAEGADTLAALAAMRRGAPCAEVLAAAGVPAPRVGATPRTATRGPSLTDRQVEVLALVAEGYAYPEIARTLGKSVETVRDRVKGAMKATSTHSAPEAAREAAAWGLL